MTHRSAYTGTITFAIALVTGLQSCSPPNPRPPPVPATIASLVGEWHVDHSRFEWIDVATGEYVKRVGMGTLKLNADMSCQYSFVEAPGAVAQDELGKWDLTADGTGYSFVRLSGIRSVQFDAKAWNHPAGHEPRAVFFVYKDQLCFPNEVLRFCFER